MNYLTSCGDGGNALEFCFQENIYRAEKWGYAFQIPGQN